MGSKCFKYSDLTSQSPWVVGHAFSPQHAISFSDVSLFGWSSVRLHALVISQAWRGVWGSGKSCVLTVGVRKRSQSLSQKSHGLLLEAYLVQYEWSFGGYTKLLTCFNLPLWLRGLRDSPHSPHSQHTPSKHRPKEGNWSERFHHN